MEPACGFCDGLGQVDSGGSLPWGEWIFVGCPECKGTGFEPEGFEPRDTPPIPEDLLDIYEGAKVFQQTNPNGRESVDGMVVRLIERIARLEAQLKGKE